MFSVAIEGASGYAGMELSRILAGHPGVSLAALSSARWAGLTVRQCLGLPGPIGELVYGEVIADEVEADVVFLATPSEASRTLAPRWLDRGARIIDLSDAYRADPEAVYGLTEHNRAALDGARLVANPGCYPTATLLAAVPLVEAGLVAPGPIVVDAKSGVTGAGRKLADHLLFNELADNHYPYGVAGHRHVPEITRGLGRAVVFTPHLIPARRGLLASIYLPVAEGVGADALRRCLQARYLDEPFVQVVDCDSGIGIAAVAHTPQCRIAVGPTVESGVARVFSSIDNLLKGAASQAVQNMNRVLGLDEKLGLTP